MAHGIRRGLRSARDRVRRRRADDGGTPAPARRRGRRGAVGIIVLSVVLLGAGTCKEPPYGISDVSETFPPRGVDGNGVKVYLSAPRHASSGERGECGWQENVNGRIFNMYAADRAAEVNGSETLTTRGYETRVSPNSPDDGWRLNREESNNWGADVHLVTHTNAFEGCGNSAQYLLVMYKTGDANSIGLRDEVLEHLDPQVPGGQNSWDCDGLGECGSDAAHIAYIELFFHTNQEATDWFVGPNEDPEATGALEASPYLGLALDEHLGYPRAATTATMSSLDAYAGFGQTAEAELRDETIAYAEAFEREQLVAECMADAGFDYEPAVAFPDGDMLEVAEHLGVGGAAAASGDSTPASRNRAYERELPADERERYNQTLLGESAADVAEADRTGEVPPGRRADEFATGGCHGEAQEAVPSIWDLRRELSPDLDALRADGSLSADAFVASHAAELGAAARRYDGALDRIRGDDALADYLAVRVAETT